MGIFNSFLVQHFTEAVWDVRPDKLRTMTDILISKASNNGFTSLLQLEDKQEAQRTYVQRRGNIAVLNIEGVLVPKASWLDAMCGFTSTLELHSIFNDLVEDRSIERIILYIDSPGGTSIAIPEFAASIFEANKQKEIVAFTDVCMCSAAYWLGAAAGTVISTPSAQVGSIGVYITLIKEKPNEEFDVHLISAGDKKLFGHPHLELSDDETTFFKETVDKHYDLFTESIATYRKVTQEDVKGTQAAHFDAINAPDWMVDQLGDVAHILS